LCEIVVLHFVDYERILEATSVSARQKMRGSVFEAQAFEFFSPFRPIEFWNLVLICCKITYRHIEPYDVW
jgi:hypothetical protein